MPFLPRITSILWFSFFISWEQCKLGEVFSYERPDRYIVTSDKYSDYYSTPVLTANKGFILGYTNEGRTYNEPCVIFDDFTLDCKYVDFPFMVKSSALKILTAKQGYYLPFAYELLHAVNIEVLGHARHYISVVQPTIVLVPNHFEQLRIGKFIEAIDNLITLHQRKQIGLNLWVLSKKCASNLANEWEQRKLGDIGRVAMNRRIFKEQTSDEGSVPFYKIGTFGGEPDAFISDELYQEYKALYPYPHVGDILLSASGSIGKMVEYKGEKAYFQDSNIVWLDHDASVSNSFLKCFYSVVKWAGLEGSTIKRLYNKNILETKIALPSYAEQVLIGDFFEGIDNLITLHQCKEKSRIDHAEKKAMFHAALKLANDWEQRKLGDLGKAQSGIGFPDKEQGGKTGIPFFKVSDMNNVGNELEMNRSNNYVSSDQIKKNGWSPIEEASVIFAKVGAAIMLNRKRLVRFSFLLDNNTMAYKFNDSWDIEFGRTLFERIDLTSLVQVGALPSYNASDVENMEVAIPQRAEQTKLGALFKSLDNLITLHQREQESFTCHEGEIVKLQKTQKLTDDWEQRKLGEIAIEVSRTDANSNAPIMMITANDGFIEQSERYAFNNAGESLKRYIVLQKGELAYNHGASKLRPYGSCFALIKQEKARIPFVYHCFSVENHNPEFVSIELNGNDVESQLRRIVSSGARMDGLLNISFQDYASISILLPEKAEQDKIASVFRNLDNLITLHQCKEKSRIAHADKKVMFHATLKLANDWEQRKLGEYFEERNERSGEGELISVTINSGIKKFNELGRFDTKPEDLSKYKRVEVGDIAYNSMRMWQGASGYSPYSGILSPAYTVISPKTGVSSLFFAYLIKRPQMIHLFEVNSQGLTSDTWNLKFPAFSQIETSAPVDIYEQENIAHLFTVLDNLITLHQRGENKYKRRQT